MVQVKYTRREETRALRCGPFRGSASVSNWVRTIKRRKAYVANGDSMVAVLANTNGCVGCCSSGAMWMEWKKAPYL